MTDISVSRATPDDVDALLPLFAGYLRFYGKPVDEVRVHDFLGARIGYQESVVFLARDAASGEALGFVQLYPAFASLSQGRSWFLNVLFVAESARGRGVSKLLMEAARQLAVTTQACELFLQTARTNAVAQKLYTSLGWVRDDEFLVYTLDPRVGPQ
jgi:GNAT superfamily N-acetyltransferase